MSTQSSRVNTVNIKQTEQTQLTGSQTGSPWILVHGCWIMVILCTCCVQTWYQLSVWTQVALRHEWKHSKFTQNKILKSYSSCREKQSKWHRTYTHTHTHTHTHTLTHTHSVYASARSTLGQPPLTSGVLPTQKLSNVLIIDFYCYLLTMNNSFSFYITTTFLDTFVHLSSFGCDCCLLFTRDDWSNHHTCTTTRCHHGDSHGIILWGSTQFGSKRDSVIYGMSPSPLRPISHL